MSFYIATCFPDRVEMLTDGLAYDSSGVVRSIGTKVHAVPGLPVAITTRGHVGAAARFVDGLTRMVQRGNSLDPAMIVLKRDLPTFAGKIRRDEAVEVCIAGISDACGPIAFHFRTEGEAGFVEPYTLYDTEETVICGITGHRFHAPIVAAGSLRNGGLALMESFRREKSDVLNVDQPAYIVGGHVDWTVITADGVKTERIHTWGNDKIGDLVNPFADDTTVTPFPAAGLNRQQRRAAARAAGKGRAA